VDEFRTKLRWGATVFCGLVFGWALLVPNHSPLVKAGALPLFRIAYLLIGILLAATLILIWRGERAGKAAVADPPVFWLAVAWSGTVILVLTPHAANESYPWIFACVCGCSLMRLQLMAAYYYALSLFAISAIGKLLQANPAINLLNMGLLFLAIAGVEWSLRTLGTFLAHADEEVSETRRVVARLTETNVRLQNHAVQVREWLLSQERYRIAREFHDTLGHNLTVVVVKIQAAQSILKGDPERALAELDTACHTARETLKETRATVSSLRDPISGELRGASLWINLCEAFAQCTGMAVTTDIDERFAAVDDNTNATIYRFIQESLTNAYRHGEPSRVDVAVWRDGDSILARISDNGQGVLKMNEGFGLTGLRERVQELGGDLSWQSEFGKGFDIAIEIQCQGGDALVQDSPVDR